MGFYGNITNTSRTQFQFDRTYANRVEMENQKSVDGIYAGRYILIEYDGDTHLDYFPRIYTLRDSNGKLRGYTDVNMASDTIIRIGVDGVFPQAGDIFYETTVLTSPTQPSEKHIFYKCAGSPGQPAEFIFVTESESNYVKNYNIDTAKYGESRGYDSTVWQKAYIDGVEKYIMIAELNTVVPTFDITADAPTLEPISPHFDVNSTDVYYKLHWQPQWGLRVKEATSTEDTSTDNQKYPSDTVVTYDKINYDASTGEETSETKTYSGAIYFNKAGFDKETRSSVAVTNDISIRPTGISGNQYNAHDGTTNMEIRPDIQEISILLPALGNTLSDIWDIVYGNESMTGGPERNLDIAWDSIEGLRMVREEDGNGFTFDTKNIETIASCINSVHDLMGMIIIDGLPANLEDGDKNSIYYDNGVYYRLFTNYDYQEITNPTPESLAGQEVYVINDTEGVYTKGALWNNNVQIPSTVTVGIRIPKTDKKELIGFARSMNTIHGLILKINELLLMGDSLTRDTSTVQGSINKLNDIINIFDNLIPKEIVIVDDYGRVHSSPYTTAQEFIATNNQTNVETKEAKSEDRWIYLDVNGDISNPQITLEHRFTSVPNTTTASDKNVATGDGVNKGIGDSIELYSPIVDNMGHVVGKNTETVTLPYGFKYITTNGRSANEDENASGVPATPQVEADNTQSIFAINSGNKWVRIDSSDRANNSLTISHDVHNITTTNKTASDLNGNGDILTIQDIVFDKAGHVTANQNHTYTLPYGFKTIKATNTSDTTVAAPASTINDTGQIADNTQDTLTFSASNRWVKFDNNAEDTVKVGHKLTTLGAGTPNQKYGLEADKNITTLNVDNTFQVPVFRFDEAGHIDFAETHTVEVPENFDKITVTLNNEVGSNKIAGTAKTISADSLTDTLNIKEGNKWILVDADDVNDALTFSHYIKQFTETTSSTNFNTSIDKTFYVQEIGWDEAGHLISSNKHTYTLPDNFKVLAINNGGQNISTVTNITPSNGNLTADSLVDTATINTGNRWIQLVTDFTNDTVTFYHAAPGVGSNTTQTGAETPNFGATFSVPEVKYDNAGHITEVATHTVTIPQPSLNDLTATNSSVLTGLEMNDTTGVITQTNANVGTRALTGYVKQTDNSDISVSDTINTAFSKLQTQIHDEEKRVTDLIGNGTLATAFDTLKEMSDWLDANDTELRADLVKSDNDLKKAIEQEVTDRGNAISGIDGKISQETTDRATAINNLTQTIESTYQKKDATFTYKETQFTLQAIISDIESRLTAIENTLNPSTE